MWKHVSLHIKYLFIHVSIDTQAKVHLHCIYLSFWFTETYSDTYTAFRLFISSLFKTGINAITVLNWNKILSEETTHCKTDWKQEKCLTAQNDFTCK